MFRRKTRLNFAISIFFVICLFFSVSAPAVLAEGGNGATIPCTVNTYGNAWSGQLAFPLSGPNNSNYLVIMDTNGTVITTRQSNGYNAVYDFANNTLLFQGEPYVDGADTAPTYATHLWNLTSNTTQDFPNVISHHDIQFDPVNNTFLTLQSYLRTVGGKPVLFDKVLQVDAEGNVLWTWDTYNYIPISEASPFNETSNFNGQTVEDFTHANSLDWDYNNSIIYLNIRNTNTFYKINQTTGDVIWACGEFGNFTLLGTNGQPLHSTNGLPPSLWYHSHDVKMVTANVFTMFDNDNNNNTNPENCHSRMIEVTLNETNMTALVNWSWEAPTQYWTEYGGATVILPNGDYLGDFGDPTHQFTENQPWNFNDTGAVFIEVNPAGHTVRTFTFPVGYYAYRVEALTKETSTVPEFSVLAFAVVIIVTAAVAIAVFRIKREPSTSKDQTSC